MYIDAREVCYYDIGNGYNENEKMYAAYEKMEITFEDMDVNDL